MRKVFKKYGIMQMSCWILLLQLINISINPPDMHYLATASVVDNRAYAGDEIESLYEYVVEAMTDIEVPENEEEEIDSISSSIDLYTPVPIAGKLLVFEFPLEHATYYHNYFHSIHPEPLFPPPKGAQLLT
jgi:hypothetical protein